MVKGGAKYGANEGMALVGVMQKTQLQWNPSRVALQLDGLQ